MKQLLTVVVILLALTKTFGQVSLTGSTSGKIPYISGVNELSESDFYINPTTKWYGFGTTNPSNKYHLQLAYGEQLKLGSFFVSNPLDGTTGFIRSTLGSNLYWNSTTSNWVDPAVTGWDDYAVIANLNSGGLGVYTYVGSGPIGRTFTQAEFQNTLRLKISGAGKVGIGGIDPSVVLDVKALDNLDQFKYRKYTTTGRITMTLANPDGSSIWNYGIITDNSTDFTVSDGTNNTLRMVKNGNLLFNPGGNVGFGTTTPTGKYDFRTGSTGRQFVVLEKMEGTENEVSLVGTTQKGFLVKDRTTATGGLWLYGGHSSGTGLEKRGGVGAGLIGDLGTLRATGTEAAFIRFQDGVITMFGNTSLTAGTTFNPNERMRINGANGFIGFGGIDPTAIQDIKPTSVTDGIKLRRFSAAGRAQIFLANESGAQQWVFGMTTASSTDVAFNDGTKNVLLMKKGGNVIFDPAGLIGIGTTNPTKTLSVNGTILAKEVYISVEPADWPDYVFGETYTLKELSEVERFIKENGHLPEIPSAMTASTEGVAVGEFNKQLLKKVEELTLYIIEQEKRIQKLESKTK
ncbi:MAG: hypothetical protein L6Q77_13235 [Bacteroidetes bacterium]|nr:hypothetical protein [Bacteroidota bacterium]